MRKTYFKVIIVAVGVVISSLQSWLWVKWFLSPCVSPGVLTLFQHANYL